MENAGTSYEGPDLSREFIEKVFREYVRRRIDIPEEEKEPLCPFSAGGECNHPCTNECYSCEFSKESFKKTAVEEIFKRYGARQRKPAKVFCVSCGNPGKRTPLRKWHGSYICQHCWKMLQVIGEEEFIRRITDGDKTDGDKTVV